MSEQNKQNPDWVMLMENNLCGTKGTLSYQEYGLQFSGRLDASGKPILLREATSRVVPIVSPYPGQVFVGHWVLHEPIRFVVVDTLWGLKLAFECPGDLPI